MEQFFSIISATLPIKFPNVPAEQHAGFISAGQQLFPQFSSLSIDDERPFSPCPLFHLLRRQAGGQGDNGAGNAGERGGPAKRLADLRGCYWKSGKPDRRPMVLGRGPAERTSGLHEKQQRDHHDHRGIFNFLRYRSEQAAAGSGGSFLSRQLLLRG